MQNETSISLGRYYLSFKSLSGALAGLVGALPLVPKQIAGSASEYAFPPLGDIEVPARIGMMALAVAVTYAAYFSRGVSAKARARGIAGFVAASALFLVFYLGLNYRFVRRIDVPSRNTSVLVSVGYERTEFANTTFGSATDEEILRQRGPEDEQIRKLWAFGSVLTARLVLFGSYCGFVLALISAVSVGIVSQLEEGKPV